MIEIFGLSRYTDVKNEAKETDGNDNPTELALGKIMHSSFMDGHSPKAFS
jgi:hypothetical protein